MESTTAYLISVITAFVILGISAVVANAIKYEGGSRPKDPQKRKAWFWVFAFLTPFAIFSLGRFVFTPEANIMIMKKYLNALTIGTIAGFLAYVIAGFVLSRIFRNGKIGHWF